MAQEYVRIKQTARCHKGKRACYHGDIFYKNGRHAVFVSINDNRRGPAILEFNADEIEFIKTNKGEKK